MMNIFLMLIPEYVSAPKRRVVAMPKLNAAVRLTRSARERSSGGGSGSSGGVEAEGQTTGRGGGGDDGLALPPLCLERIMCCLAEQAADPCGLVGPCLAARDIASASLACWDLHNAAKPAFAALAVAAERAPFAWVEPLLSERIPALRAPKAGGAAPAAGGPLRVHHRLLRLKLPGKDLSWEQWDQILASPMDLRLCQLKTAASALGASVTGTKAQLAGWIFDQLGLAGPPTAPAKLLRACAAERSVPIDRANRLAGGAFRRLIAGLASRGLKPLGQKRLDAAPYSLALARAELRRLLEQQQWRKRLREEMDQRVALLRAEQQAHAARFEQEEQQRWRERLQAEMGLRVALLCAQQQERAARLKQEEEERQQQWRARFNDEVQQTLALIRANLQERARLKQEEELQQQRWRERLQAEMDQRVALLCAAQQKQQQHAARVWQDEEEQQQRWPREAGLHKQMHEKRRAARRGGRR